MAEDNKDQKTEEPSSKRITDTEEKGNFAHSREINSAFILLAALSGFMITGDQSTRNVLEAWHNMISEASYIQLNTEELFKVATNTMKAFFKIVGPFLLMIMFAGIASNVVQIGGLRFSGHPLIPKFNKLNPMKGFGRIFSKNSFDFCFSFFDKKYSAIKYNACDFHILSEFITGFNIFNKLFSVSNSELYKAFL